MPSFQGTPANIRINLILSESRVIGLHRRRWQHSLSSFKFSWWSPKDARVLKQCVRALQGHPRSLILTPIESAYATSYYYRSSIVTLVLPCPVSEVLQISRDERPHLYSTLIDWLIDWLTRLPMLWLDPRSEDPKLIIPVINFQLFQPICSYALVTRVINNDGKPCAPVRRRNYARWRTRGGWRRPERSSPMLIRMTRKSFIMQSSRPMVPRCSENFVYRVYPSSVYPRLISIIVLSITWATSTDSHLAPW